MAKEGGAERFPGQQPGWGSTSSLSPIRTAPVPLRRLRCHGRGCRLKSLLVMTDRAACPHAATTASTSTPSPPVSSEASAWRRRRGSSGDRIRDRRHAAVRAPEPIETLIDPALLELRSCGCRCRHAGSVRASRSVPLDCGGHRTVLADFVVGDGSGQPAGSPAAPAAGCEGRGRPGRRPNTSIVQETTMESVTDAPS